MTTTILDLDRLDLKHGSHQDRTDGVCLLEAVAWYAGEKHGDMPACVSPVLRSYGIALNDQLPDERRQELKRFIPALVGTAGDGLDDRRRQIAQTALTTDLLPPWLRLAKLDDLAIEVEGAAGLTTVELRKLLRRVADEAWNARYERRIERRARIKALLVERLPAAAVAAAVAVAVADAAADAAAAAAAVAAADAVADAAAAAAAAAVADAAAVAVADAAAAAVADAAAAAAADAVADAAAAAAADADAAAAAAKKNFDRYTFVYAEVRKAMRTYYEQAESFAAIRALRDEQRDVAFDLYERLITAEVAGENPR